LEVAEDRKDKYVDNRKSYKKYEKLEDEDREDRYADKKNYLKYGGEQ
jgi:hypothetical protein